MHVIHAYILFTVITFFLQKTKVKPNNKIHAIYKSTCFAFMPLCLIFHMRVVNNELMIADLRCNVIYDIHTCTVSV